MSVETPRPSVMATLLQRVIDRFDLTEITLWQSLHGLGSTAPLRCRKGPWSLEQRIQGLAGQVRREQAGPDERLYLRMPSV